MTQVAFNDDGDDLPSGYNQYASRIVYTAPYTGTYYAKIIPYNDGYAGDFDFLFGVTCLISQSGCADDGGTFGTCSTVAGLEKQLVCLTAADGYQIDGAGTVTIFRTIECDKNHGGGKDFDREDDYRFCTAFVR